MRSHHIVFGLALAILAAINLRILGFCFEDDAFISYRYLDNLLSGKGLLYNPGERVEGYSNLLWILLLIPMRLLGLTPEAGSYLLALMSLALMSIGTFRLASWLTPGSPWAGWISLLFLATAISLLRWVGSGMETVLFAALLLLAVERGLRRGNLDYQTALWLGLACLTRSEGIGYAGLVVAWLLWHRRSQIRDQLVPLAFFAAWPGAQLLFRRIYYGEWLPNTYYVKLSGQSDWIWEQGATYLWHSMSLGIGLMLVTASVYFLVGSKRRFGAVLLLVLVGFCLLFTVRAGGDYLPYARFLASVQPLIMALAAAGLVLALSKIPSSDRLLIPAAIGLAAAQLYLGLDSRDFAAHEFIRTTNKEREKVAQWILRRYPKGSVLAINAAGVVPYRTGFYTIDMLGLNDRYIARTAERTVPDGAVFTGHRKFDGNYVCEKRPDLVLTSSGHLQSARNAKEARTLAALNTFASDRDFLRHCGKRYSPLSEELDPGIYLIGFVPDAEGLSQAPDQSSNARAWFEWGNQLLGKAQIDAARRAFFEALKRHPDSPVILTSIAYTYLDQGRYQESLARFQGILKRWPGHANAVYGLALTYENLHQREAAIETWRRYLKLATDATWRSKARQHSVCWACIEQAMESAQRLGHGSMISTC